MPRTEKQLRKAINKEVRAFAKQLQKKYSDIAVLARADLYVTPKKEIAFETLVVYFEVAGKPLLLKLPIL